jgi:imidazolonepropionase-like amidohydrolase
LVLIDGDPTTTISDIRKVILTIKDGNIYASKDLLKAISVKNYDEAK